MAHQVHGARPQFAWPGQLRRHVRSPVQDKAVRNGPICARGDIPAPCVPTGAVTRPPICRWHGGLVSAAELLIRLARVEDQPVDPILEGQVPHTRLPELRRSCCPGRSTAQRGRGARRPDEFLTGDSHGATWFHVRAVDLPEGSLSIAQGRVTCRRPIRVTCRSRFPRQRRSAEGASRPKARARATASPRRCVLSFV
jgi:hypothetical protein